MIFVILAAAFVVVYSNRKSTGAAGSSPAAAPVSVGVHPITGNPVVSPSGGPVAILTPRSPVSIGISAPVSGIVSALPILVPAPVLFAAAGGTGSADQSLNSAGWEKSNDKAAANAGMDSF